MTDRILWRLGITYSPIRRVCDGHGYSRLGCFWRRRRYVTPREYAYAQRMDGAIAGMAEAYWRGHRRIHAITERMTEHND